MKILYIVPYVPGPVRVRPYNLIRSLAGRGHAITLATLISSPAEDRDLERLRDSCARIIAFPLSRFQSVLNSGQAMLTGIPLQANWCWQPELASALCQTVRQDHRENEFDVIHVEHLRGARYGLALRRKYATETCSPPVVWDSVDSISLLFRQAARQSSRLLSRWIAQIELPRTEKYERWLTSQFSRILVTSPVDQKALQSLADRPAEIDVLPNGVDLDHFCPGDQPKDPQTLVISGKMSYHANVTMVLDLVREIMPRIWNYNPEVRVVIVGKDPGREIWALAGDQRIQVTGTVEDITPYLQKSTVAVAPIRYGAGIQNKILEAMATATPVVTTPQGASALRAQPGEDLLVAEGADDFARKTLDLLEYPEERRRIGEAGYRYVRTVHQWGHIAEQLESIYQNAIENSWISSAKL